MILWKVPRVLIKIHHTFTLVALSTEEKLEVWSFYKETAMKCSRITHRSYANLEPNSEQVFSAQKSLEFDIGKFD